MHPGHPCIYTIWVSASIWMHRSWVSTHKIEARGLKWISSIVFKFGWMKCKWVYPNRFWKYIQMQIRCMNCRGDKFQHHWLVYFDLRTLASSAVVVNKLAKKSVDLISIDHYWISCETYDLVHQKFAVWLCVQPAALVSETWPPILKPYIIDWKSS